MLKKLFLSTIVTTISLTASTETISRAADLQDSLAHITQETKTIIFEMQMALTLAARTEKHFQKLLQDNYQSTKEKCLALLSTIATSTEFITTIDQVTDAQIDLIVEKNAKFNDIIIDPTMFPLEQKIKDELALAAFDKQTEQLFNVFYVALAITRGSQALLKKLELKKTEFIAELETLHAPDQTINVQTL